jgi:hypothetical protein
LAKANRLRKVKNLAIAVIVLGALLACERPQVKDESKTTVRRARTDTSDALITDDSIDPVIVASVASSTGTGAIPAEDSLTPVHFSSRQDSLCGEMGENGLNVPVGRRAVAAKFGKPDSVRADPGPNPYEPTQIDTVMDVFYPGLRLKYWVMGKPPADNESLLEAEITDNKYLRFPQLGIGATRDEIVRTIGEPGDRTDDTFKYECGLHIMSGANVTFHFADRRVTLVDFYWEMD